MLANISAGTAIALFVALISGCAASRPSTATEAPKVPQNITLSEWERCGEEAIKKRERECAREGITPGYCFGNTGAIWEIENVCGHKPSSGELSKDERNALEEWCKEQTGWAEAISRVFYPYGEGSSHWNLAVKECERIYAANAGTRAEEQRKLKAAKQAEKERRHQKPLSIERVHQSSDNYASIIVRTNRAREVKCALLNNSGDYIRVETAFVTPPVDEFVIRSGSAPWASAECWFK